MSAEVSELVFERLPAHARLEDLEQEWRELEPELLQVPFVTYDWMYTWWQSMRAQKASVSDGLWLCTARTRSGKLRGIAPLMRTDRPAFGPLRMRQVHLLGADPNITELRSVLAPPSELPRVLKLLIDHLRQAAHEWDFMQLSGVPADVRSALALDGLSDLGGALVRDVPNYYLPLAPSWEEFKKGLSRNIKESLRKCYNAPKRDGVILEFDVVREPSEVRSAISDFLELHRSRSTVESGVKHPDVFSTSQSVDFLQAVCLRFAERDRLRIFRTKVEGRVIAARIGFVCGDCLYLYYSGYDPAFGRYSVMTTTVAEAIQFAIREGFSTVNLSTGADVSKLRWSPKELVYTESQLVSPSLRGALTYQSYSWVRKHLDRAKGNPHLAGLLGRRA
jgi:CelD/BcsL family acetyltransferase involved in cellulose biosynthesis